MQKSLADPRSRGEWVRGRVKHSVDGPTAYLVRVVVIIIVHKWSLGRLEVLIGCSLRGIIMGRRYVKANRNNQHSRTANVPTHYPTIPYRGTGMAVPEN
ncbi:hypothetical protein M378DRAFT_628633 [Amanita muscaria Koide BX008]|uniref:Uncharacterized protein n=1 Tax=Amanita muscaria (strain Koide BX008) TaxID=946122 RepID=A0A0C2WRA8_AMAMK|nr:hypothetical protein M378DRAFT_628633 [Amanita muscaria Koide BX008]